MLLVASYVFYGYWDWRFLSLILLSTLIDFSIGRKLYVQNDPSRRKLLLLLSVIANLSILGFFKYFNFFAENFESLVGIFGLTAGDLTLRILLPIGISFYTFQTMSYTIDIYRGKLKPTKNLMNFALFVAFFPQLVAGPIERAKNMLPQIENPRNITPQLINSGIYLIIWGYFKKLVIADNVALIANQVFNNYTDYHGMDIVIGVIAFTVQIYCDFSAYSDIARGLSKLLGINLMLNFRLPYFALNPSDFWSRWHISLSSWLRDYLYIPLGGNRSGKGGIYRNLMITMLLGGLWHGAAWNFVIWGAFHGSILIIYRLVSEYRSKRKTSNNKLSIFSIVAQMALMFILTVIGWIIFRSESIEQIIYLISNLGFITSLNTVNLTYILIFFSFPLLLTQILQYVTGDLEAIMNLKIWWRVPILSGMLVWILVFSVRESTEFIYFQF